jgi:hypothetical protein
MQTRACCFLEQAWNMIPPRWQLAMDKAISQGAMIVTPPQLIALVKRANVTWVYHPIRHPGVRLTSTGMKDTIAFLKSTDAGDQILCAWNFKVNFVSPQFYFQKHFIRTLAIAVYLKNEKLREIISRLVFFPKDSVEAELFYGYTYYKWCMSDCSASSFAEEPYGAALALFDRIDNESRNIL